jgi:hypothetical protein
MGNGKQLDAASAIASLNIHDSDSDVNNDSTQLIGAHGERSLTARTRASAAGGARFSRLLASPACLPFQSPAGLQMCDAEHLVMTTSRQRPLALPAAKPQPPPPHVPCMLRLHHAHTPPPASTRTSSHPPLTPQRRRRKRRSRPRQHSEVRLVPLCCCLASHDSCSSWSPSSLP